MIRFIVAAVWICAVTVGSIVYAYTAADKKAAAVVAPAPHFGGLDYVKTDVISVPVVRENVVNGYFLARLVYTVDPKRAAALSVPAQSLITDQVFTYLYGNPQIDFTVTDNVDLDAMRKGLREAVNARIGEELIHDVLIEQVDYLSKAEIRDNTARRRAAAQVPALNMEQTKAH